MNIRKTGLLFLTLFLISCGFKLADQDYNYSLIEIDVNGNSRISYYIKNELIANTNKNLENQISLNLNLSQNKSVKEKNINNKITKYEIEIIANVQFETGPKKIKDQFSVAKKGVYNVMAIYSETLNNERKLIEQLSKAVSDEILTTLSINFNDK